MKNILEEIAARTRERIAKEKMQVSVSELENRIQEGNKKAEKKMTFLQSLQKDGMSYICEVKKASPSKGLIAPEFPYLAIAQEYEQAGASAISCLTEPFYFQGSDQYLREIAGAVQIPVLRKDFTVDEYIIANCEYPGEWDGIIERTEMVNELIITVTQIYPRDKSISFHVISFIQTKDDKIVAMDEYYADDGSAPQWRLDKHIGTSVK